MTEQRMVAVLGASSNPERYSNRAIKALIIAGHSVLPVNPRGHDIEGIKAYPDIRSLPSGVDTLTVYLNPKAVMSMLPQIKALKPQRVILNPGTEDPALEHELRKSGIQVVKACTLVLLSTGQF
jgi:uncharacterized protein